MSVAFEFADPAYDFPPGIKYVVEGDDAGDGRVRIVARYLIYPDGNRVDLLARGPRVFECGCARARARQRRRREGALAAEFA